MQEQVAVVGPMKWFPQTYYWESVASQDVSKDTRYAMNNFMEMTFLERLRVKREVSHPIWRSPLRQLLLLVYLFRFYLPSLLASVTSFCKSFADDSDTTSLHAYMNHDFSSIHFADESCLR
eukprot:5479182-Amphidinium_carterae.5